MKTTKRESDKSDNGTLAKLFVAIQNRNEKKKRTQRNADSIPAILHPPAAQQKFIRHFLYPRANP